MLKRSFIVGSKWLYFKIYLGPKTADVILTEILFPLTTELREKELIEKWFFIRYADPKHHLRVRFCLSNTDYLGEVIQRMYHLFSPLIDQNLIWKVQLDTYNRELERYGENTIELSETLFWHDSEAIIRFIDLIEGDEGERLRWLFGLRAIDNLLNVFDYPLADKLSLAENLKTSFGEEFGMSRPLKKQLDKKYRDQSETIVYFMGFKTEENLEYAPILAVLEQSCQNMLPIAKLILEIEKKESLQVSKNDLMGSYIHMSMNRLFKSKNRLNEMVSYDFLYRYYKSLHARKDEMLQK